ncbi:MAG: heme ABC transporter ATP-binding protein [Acidimicrobiia bacterium]|nr:heme ABC transporter ATP-binding protein [Acidimicrobiia bacterium]
MSAGVTGRGLGFEVEGRALLAGVDVDAAPGEVLGILGPNGAGKTTLLRVLSGEWTPTSGTVELLGRPLAAMSSIERARVRAVLPQHTVLAFAFRCLDVVLMGRYAATSGDDAAVARRSMATTDSGHLADRTYPTLSGGEQTRVSLARVLAQETPVLFLDEPTASLDLRHQELVMRTLRGLADRGAVVVAALHDLNVAARFADRVALLAEGRLHAIGATATVLTGPIVEAVYGQRVTVVPHPVLGSPLILPHDR